MSSRSSGWPIVGYTVRYFWPSDPRRRLRVAVYQADERTARESLEALIRMHCAVQVDVTVREPYPNQDMVQVFTSARWDRLGRVTDRHFGRFEGCIPAWASGTEVEKRNESAPHP